MDTPHLTPPFVSSRIVVFSDFNCPYCFTLNEWLYELRVSHRIRWVGIEHKPELPVDGGENAPKDLALLHKEVEDVARRAPEVAVSAPRTWANSRQALLLQNAIEDDEPGRAPEVRRSIFRRYWQKGSAAFSTHALQEVLAELSLEEPELEPEYLETMTEWWRSKLDRIPALVAPTGITHLGLQDKDRVRAFVNSAIRASQPGPGCR